MGGLYAHGAIMAARVIAEVAKKGEAAGKAPVTAAEKGIIGGRVMIDRGSGRVVAVVIVTIVVATRTARRTGKSGGYFCEVVGSQGALEAGATTGRWLPLIDPGRGSSGRGPATGEDPREEKAVGIGAGDKQRDHDVSPNVQEPARARAARQAQAVGQHSANVREGGSEASGGR